MSRSSLNPFPKDPVSSSSDGDWSDVPADAPAPAASASADGWEDVSNDGWEDVGSDLTPKKTSAKKEIGKAVVRSFDNLMEGFGHVTRWVGDNIANDDELRYKAVPWQEKETVINVRRSDFEKKVGGFLISKGKSIADYWDDRAKTGFEAPDPEIFKGSFMENPSWTRGAALVAEAVPSLGAAAAITIATKSPIAGAFFLGGVEGAGQYTEAREAGKTVRQANVVGGLSTLGNTVLESLPLHGFLKGSEKTFKKGMAAVGIKMSEARIPTLAKEMFYGAVNEGGEEVAQQFWSNIVAKIGYDNTRNLAEGMIESLIAGAGSGGVVGGFTAGRAKGLDKAMDSAKKQGVNQGDLDLMGQQIARQIITNGPKIEEQLSKQLDMKVTEAQKLSAAEVPPVSVPGPEGSLFAEEPKPTKFLERPSYGMELPAGDVRRVPLKEISEEHKYQVEGRGLNRQVVDEIKRKMQLAAEKGEPIPVNISKPILLNKEGNQYYLIGGHHRSTAFREMGMQDVEAQIINVSPDIAKLYAEQDNIQFNNPPTVQGHLFRRELERGRIAADIIQDLFGPVNPTSKKYFDQTVDASYLPAPTKALVDDGTIPLDLGAAIGGKMRSYKLDLSPDVVWTLFENYHVKQGLSAPAMSKVLDTIFSVAESKTVSKEKQLDLFGKMIKAPDVMGAAIELEKIRNQAAGAKRQLDSIVKQASKSKMQLKQETVDDLKNQSMVFDSKIKELNEKLYKFKLEDMVGTIKKEIDGNTVEMAVESGTAGTVELPNFKKTREAIEFGKANRNDEKVIAALRAASEALKPGIERAKVEGNMQEGMNLAVKMQFYNEAVQAAETPVEELPVNKEVVAASGDLFPTAQAARDAKKKEQTKLGRDVEGDTRQIRETASKTGDLAKAEILMNLPEVTPDALETTRQSDLLRRAVEVAKTKEARKNKIDSEDRELTVYTFEAALDKYQIDKEVLGQKMRKWIKVLENKLKINGDDYLSYAWEGMMTAMGAQIITEEVNGVKTEKLITRFNPDKETKKGGSPSDKFFEYSKAYMQKWITRYGLPNEKNVISIQSTQINEVLHNFIQLQQAADTEEDIERLWGEYMPESFKYSEDRYRRLQDAARVKTVSIDAPITPDGGSDYSLMDTFSTEQDPIELNDRDMHPFESELYTEKQEIQEAEETVRKEGPMAEVAKRLSRLTAQERDIVKMAFGLTESEYGYSLSPEQIADAMNGVTSEPTNVVRTANLFGEVSQETKSNKAMLWTPATVAKVLEKAMKKMGDLTDIQLLAETKGRQANAGPNEMNDFFNEGGIAAIPETDTADELEGRFRKMMGDERGFIRIPDLPTIDPLVAQEMKEAMADKYFHFAGPYWVARTNPLFAPVFNGVLKHSIYGYNRYTHVIQSIMNNFQDFNQLGLKRADQVAEVIYKNAGKEEAKRAERLGQAVQWYSADQLKNDFGFDDDQVRVYKQLTRLVRYEVSLLKKQYRLANDYFTKRTIEVQDGGVVFETKETDAEFIARRQTIDARIKEKFPEVYIPINRYGNVWVVAEKVSHYDKKGKPVYDRQFHLVEAEGINPMTRMKPVRDLEAKLKSEGYTVNINRKNDLNYEAVWEQMDLYELERLLEYAGVNWPKGPEQTQEGHKSDLHRLKDYVDKVRSSKGGVYGNFLKRDWKSGYRTDAEHLKRSLITFGEGSARFLARYEGNRAANEALKQIPHGAKAPRDMKKLHNYASAWLDYYKDANTGTWSGIRTAAYMYFLAGKLSFFVQNLTQPFFTTYIRLAGDLGGLEPEHVFTQSYINAAKFLNYEKSISRGRKVRAPFDSNLMSALKRAKKAEIITGTFTDMLLATKTIESSEKGKNFLHNFFGNKDYRHHLLGILGTKSEKINRLHAFLTGWEAGIRKGFTGDTLYDFAADYVSGTQWSYGAHNLPVFLTSKPNKVRAALQTILLFQTHKYNWFQFTTQELRETLSKTPDGKREWDKFAGLLARLGATFGFWVGARGIPLYAVLNAIVQKSTGKPIHQAIREMLAEMFPDKDEEQIKGLARIITTGYVSDLTGLDLSSQIGFGDAISVEYASGFDEFALGAIYTKGKAIVSYGIPSIIEGYKFKNKDQLLRGLEVTAPSAVGQIFRGARLYNDEAVRLKTGEKVRDLKGDAKWGAALTSAAGLQSTETSEAFMERQSKNAFRDKKQAISQRFAYQMKDAVSRNDYARVRMIKERIREFNEKNPDMKVRITPQMLREAKRKFKKGVTSREYPRAMRKQIKKIESTY